MDYVELHLHNHYSLLDGYNTAAEYMERAKELGMTHLAETNHGTLSGHREHQRAAKAAGITPILGVEAYISATDRFDRRTKAKRGDGTSIYNHIGLLARNENGLRNLNLLMSEAWHTGYYYNPRIDMELLEQHSDDIIVLSGCLSGLIAKSLEAGDMDRAMKTANHLKDIFGERFFIELQAHNPKEINDGLWHVVEKCGIEPVVTSDCHYSRKEDLWVEQAMLIIATNPKAAKGIDLSKSQKMDKLERFNYLYPDRTMNFEEYELYLHSADEHRTSFGDNYDIERMLANTVKVASMIGDYPYYEGLDLLPRPDVKGKSPDDLLRDKVMNGMRYRGHLNDPERVAKVNEELDIIKKLGFASYFLVQEDLTTFARQSGIFIGPGRGSAISFSVNYYLGITGIDPVPYKLQSFRFLDPEREDWPDIDTDFEKDRRHEVKEYAIRKYKHVANIATFGYFKGNSAIRDAARVYKIPLGEVNKALKGVSTLEAFKTNEGTKAFRDKYPEVLELAERLQGRIRSMGVHAGGLVFANQPIENYVPMQTATDPQDSAAGRVSVVASDMKDVAKIGMIKFDELGLKTLTVIKDALQMIEDRTGQKIDPYEIPLDDTKVYETLSAGYTKGVFQCEAGPYTKKIIEMGGVKDFNDLAASNALVRPGASNSSIGAAYIEGKINGNFEYIHECTKYFTEDTYGQILYQEQTMLLCKELAGMTMGEANKVRGAIGKKIYEDLIVWKPRFIEGAAKLIGEKKAEAVWDDLEKSAEYQFNKAHAVGYSLLGYWTAWLKVNYPLEFMCAALRHEGDKNMRLDYLMECKRLGIKILLPHVNKSSIDNQIEGDGIRLGLSSIKYISGKVGAKIVEGSPYKSYEQLVEYSRIKGSGINSRAIEAMNKVGAAVFDDNPRTGNERDNFYEYLDIPAFDSKGLEPYIKAQFRDLDEYVDDETFVICAMVRNLVVKDHWARVDVVDETGSAGIFTDPSTPLEKGKMYVILVSNNRVARYITTDDIVEGKGGALTKFLEKQRLDLDEGQYRCISFKTRKTKAGSRMGEAILTDADKNLVPIMVFNNMLDRASIPLAASAKIKPEFAETRSGGIYLKDIR